jgi:diguanylate cyclase (GGDEF)-like protein
MTDKPDILSFSLQYLETHSLPLYERLHTLLQTEDKDYAHLPLVQQKRVVQHLFQVLQKMLVEENPAQILELLRTTKVHNPLRQTPQTENHQVTINMVRQNCHLLRRAFFSLLAHADDIDPDHKLHTLEHITQTLEQVMQLAIIPLQREYIYLKQRVDELEQHNRDIMLLSEMGDYLQSSLTLNDAYQVVTRFANQLFRKQTGALFTLSPSHNIVEAVATWGNPPFPEQIFAAHSCWALRRGRTHIEENPQIGCRCEHIDASLPAAYICMPLIAQGKTFGLLRLRNMPDANLPEFERWRQLATMVGEHIALALANLQLREQLRDQSIHDLQTGLFNRRYLEETMERHLRNATYQDQPVSLVMGDIDHLKNINDTYGYMAGDVTLRTIGIFWQQHTTGEEVAGRYGGEEFLLVLPNTSLEAAQERAETLCQDIKTLHVHYQGDDIEGITLSIGVACFPQHGRTSDEMLNAVSSAMSHAKALGRDRVAGADVETTDLTCPDRNHEYHE